VNFHPLPEHFPEKRLPNLRLPAGHQRRDQRDPQPRHGDFVAHEAHPGSACRHATLTVGSVELAELTGRPPLIHERVELHHHLAGAIDRRRVRRQRDALSCGSTMQRCYRSGAISAVPCVMAGTFDDRRRRSLWKPLRLDRVRADLDADLERAHAVEIDDAYRGGTGCHEILGCSLRHGAGLTLSHRRRREVVTAYSSFRRVIDR